MTQNEYTDYRARVLAKTVGINARKVNELLGIIQDNLITLTYWNRQLETTLMTEDEKATAYSIMDTCTMRVTDALTEIEKLTGVKE